MNRKHIVVAALFAAFGSSAFAQEATPDTWMNVASSKSRDQVRAELQAARKDGTVGATAPQYKWIERSAAVKTRDQVKAELAAARESGEYEMLNSEAYAFGPAPRSTGYAHKQ